jgi:hypothetical protein
MKSLRTSSEACPKIRNRRDCRSDDRLAVTLLSSNGRVDDNPTEAQFKALCQFRKCHIRLPVELQTELLSLT